MSLHKILEATMGQKHSKPVAKEKTTEELQGRGHQIPQTKTRNPLSYRSKKRARKLIPNPTTDINNNNTKVVDSYPVVTLLENHRKPNPSNRNIATPLWIFQSTFNRLFSSKKVIKFASTPNTYENDQRSTGTNHRSTPIVRRNPTSRKSRDDMYGIRNKGFSRPMTPEIVNARNDTALMPYTTDISSTGTKVVSTTPFPMTIAKTPSLSSAVSHPISNPTSPNFSSAPSQPKSTVKSPTLSTAMSQPILSAVNPKPIVMFQALLETKTPQPVQPTAFTVGPRPNIEHAKLGQVFQVNTAIVKPDAHSASLSNSGSGSSSGSGSYPSTSTNNQGTVSRPRPQPDRFKGTKRETGTFKMGAAACCKPKVAPPAYLDYGSSSSGNNTCGGRRTGNPIIDRLKNVDVIEELNYFVPGQNEGGCEGAENGEGDYFYVCDGCGEMEAAPQSSQGGGKSNPVTYSRRQRFNFQNDMKTGGEEDCEEDGPPFKWPGERSCRCPCCVAGLRRPQNCGCKCCQEKGRARVVNSFDEIPVGKNPEPRPRKENECKCEEEEDMDMQRCEELMPRESGIYFYDAEEKIFIRQVPRTPTPIVLERPRPLKTPQVPLVQPPVRNPDLAQVVKSLPPRKRRQIKASPQQPILMPPICGDINDMGTEILANAEIALRGGNPVMNPCMPCCGMQPFPMAMGSSYQTQGTQGKAPTNQTNNVTSSSKPKTNSVNKSVQSPPVVEPSYNNEEQESVVVEQIVSNEGSNGSGSGQSPSIAGTSGSRSDESL